MVGQRCGTISATDGSDPHAIRFSLPSIHKTHLWCEEKDRVNHAPCTCQPTRRLRRYGVSVSLPPWRFPSSHEQSFLGYHCKRGFVFDIDNTRKTCIHHDIQITKKNTMVHHSDIHFAVSNVYWCIWNAITRTFRFFVILVAVGASLAAGFPYIGCDCSRSNCNAIATTTTTRLCESYEPH